jgi:hypothetical protein
MTRIEDITPEEEREFEAAAIAAARSRPPPVVHHPSQPQVSQVNTNISETHPLPMQMPPAGAPGSAPTPPAPLEDTAHTTEEYMTICRSFIEQLRSGSAPWLLQRLNNTYGTMPDDPSEFSYWMALVRLLSSPIVILVLRTGSGADNQVMPIDEYEKARLLPIRSPRLRLKLIVHWIDSLRSSWW